jgi:hypothetical protein
MPGVRTTTSSLSMRLLFLLPTSNVIALWHSTARAPGQTIRVPLCPWHTGATDLVHCPYLSEPCQQLLTCDGHLRMVFMVLGTAWWSSNINSTCGPTLRSRAQCANAIFPICTVQINHNLTAGKHESHQWEWNRPFDEIQGSICIRYHRQQVGSVEPQGLVQGRFRGAWWCCAYHFAFSHWLCVPDGL